MLHRTKQLRLLVLVLFFVAIPVWGAEIHDAAKRGDIEKVKSLQPVAQSRFFNQMLIKKSTVNKRIRLCQTQNHRESIKGLPKQ